LINGGMNILNIIISSVLIYGASPGRGWACRRRSGANHCPLYWRDSHIWVLMVGFNPRCGCR
jgi:hypothetical protein